jgi:hypothetical protein
MIGFTGYKETSANIE